MNAIVPAGHTAALVPRSMPEAMQMAEMMAKTGFLARELQTPGGALFVVEQSMRWNMSPFAVAMETSFIQGKPMFSGKIVAAAVVSMGAVSGRLNYEYAGEGDNRTITVSGTIRGEDRPREVKVRLGDAKTNNKMWQSQADQQLAYHGARVWARRHTPEVMLGVYSPEEMPEAEPVAPLPPARGTTINSTAERVATPEPQVALIVLAPDGTEKDAPAIEQWVRWSLAAIGKMESGAALSRWQTAMEAHLETVARAYPGEAQQIRDAASDRLDALASAWESEESAA